MSEAQTQSTDLLPLDSERLQQSHRFLKQYPGSLRSELGHMMARFGDDAPELAQFVSEAADKPGEARPMLQGATLAYTMISQAYGGNEGLPQITEGALHTIQGYRESAGSDEVFGQLSDALLAQQPELHQLMELVLHELPEDSDRVAASRAAGMVVMGLMAARQEAEATQQQPQPEETPRQAAHSGHLGASALGATSREEILSDPAPPQPKPEAAPETAPTAEELRGKIQAYSYSRWRAGLDYRTDQADMEALIKLRGKPSLTREFYGMDQDLRGVIQLLPKALERARDVDDEARRFGELLRGGIAPNKGAVMFMDDPELQLRNYLLAYVGDYDDGGSAGRDMSLVLLSIPLEDARRFQHGEDRQVSYWGPLLSDLTGNKLSSKRAGQMQTIGSVEMTQASLDALIFYDHHGDRTTERRDRITLENFARNRFTQQQKDEMRRRAGMR